MYNKFNLLFKLLYYFSTGTYSDIWEKYVTSSREVIIHNIYVWRHIIHVWWLVYGKRLCFVWPIAQLNHRNIVGVTITNIWSAKIIHRWRSMIRWILFIRVQLTFRYKLTFIGLYIKPWKWGLQILMLTYLLFIMVYKTLRHVSHISFS